MWRFFYDHFIKNVNNCETINIRNAILTRFPFLVKGGIYIRNFSICLIVPVKRFRTLGSLIYSSLNGKLMLQFQSTVKIANISFFFFESCKQQVPQISLMKERLCKKWIWSLKYLMIHLPWTTILPMAILKIDSIHPLCMINFRVSLHKICENTSFHWPVFSCVRTKSAILSSYGGIRVSETRILVYFMQCLLSNRTKKLLLCQN